MTTVYHFDIPVDEANRAQQFYKDVFGWDMKKMTSQVDPNIELWMCETEDENGRKGITGGMMKRDKLPTVTNYISVNSIDGYISKINRSGGRVAVQRTEIPNLGFFAMFLDSENICHNYNNPKTFTIIYHQQKRLIISISNRLQIKPQERETNTGIIRFPFYLLK